MSAFWIFLLSREKSGKMDIVRDENGRFVKGHTGNPKGRTPKKYTLSDILREKLTDTIKVQKVSSDGNTTEELRIKADALLEKWLAIALSGDKNAIKDIIERLEGKPIQAIAGVKDEPLTVKVIRSSLADDETASDT